MIDYTDTIYKTLIIVAVLLNNAFVLSNCVVVLTNIDTSALFIVDGFVVDVGLGEGLAALDAGAATAAVVFPTLVA